MPNPVRRRVVLDTDTYNEVDDQFALAHLLLSPDKFDFEAVYAAPFLNDRSKGPADGMEKSYEEILRVLDLVPVAKPPKVFRGSTTFLPSANKPVQSEAVTDLIERAMGMKAGEKLLVLGIAVATNLASALLLEPRIAKKIEIVWLGGHAPYWPNTREFNLDQDCHAARVLLDQPVPLIQIPCHPVASHLLITIAELKSSLAPYSKLGAYLTEIVIGYNKGSALGWSKPIWDISASAYAINPAWFTVYTAPSPVLRKDVTWAEKPGRRKIQIIRQLDRDAIFADFYTKAQKSDKKHR